MNLTPNRSAPPRFRRGLRGNASGPVLAVAAAIAVIAILAVWAMSRSRSEAPSAGAASTSTAANMGPLEPGVNRQGRDLSDFGLRTVDARECANRCAVTAACKAMTFARTAEKEGVCWLKSAVPEASPNPELTSAVKLEAPPP